MISLKQAIWLFILLLSLACSGWFFASHPAVPKLNEQDLSKTTDMTIRQLTVRQFDAKGRLSNQLTTSKLHHIPRENMHWLQTPHILISQNAHPPITINSLEATAYQGGQQITFDKHVLIHQTKDKQTEEATIKTESITFFPKEKSATSTREITLDQGSKHLRAARATTQFNLKNQLIKAVMEGNAKTQAHYWALNARNKPEVHAYADVISYYPERHLIELQGHALVQQGQDSFSGILISYNTLRRHVISKSDGTVRTKLIYHTGKHP
ncbi:MAG: LPS export ABC transporter periplasmic protein LptC [Legionellales bacterium]|nr:LPS export ABC transporter periplasmic protein LptC [Legionellales bacterium]